MTKEPLDSSSKSQIYIVLWFSIIYSMIYNLIDFIRYPVYGDLLSTVGLFLLSVILVFWFFLVASLHKILFNIMVVITVFLSSATLYYVFVYKIRVYILDTFILLLQTNKNEALSVISYDLIIFVVIMMVIAILFLAYYNKKNFVKRDRARIIIILLLFPLLFTLKKSRVFMPYAFPYAIKMYNTYVTTINKTRLDISQFPTYFDKKKNSDLVIIFILGEAARADHFSINGYHRSTSPNLERLQAVSLPHIDSIYGVTNDSVPMMLTRASQQNYDIVYSETSFISIFNKNGFTTAWITYQDVIDNSYSKIAPLANEALIKLQMNFHPSTKSNFGVDKGKFLDEIMLPELEKVLKNYKNPKFIVLHCQGSHWNFNLRYPDAFQKFNPICTANNVGRCGREELNNSYDNSLLYTDYFISRVIKRVNTLNSIVIYCSDHGEFLGEDGYYGHIPGHRRKEITNPAMFVWMSDVYKKRNPDKLQNLLKNKNRAYTTEIIFHSILDAASITGNIIKSELSIFQKH